MGRNRNILTEQQSVETYMQREMRRNSDILTGKSNTLTPKQARDILSSKEQIYDMIKSRCETFQVTYEQLLSDPVQELVRIGKCQDVYTEYQRIENEQKQSVKDLRATFDGLKRLAAKVNRVFVCLNLLPPDEFLILSDILLQKKKWDVVAMEREIGRSTISRLLNGALDKICFLYNSDFSDSRLRKMTYDEVFSVKKSSLTKKANGGETANQETQVAHQMTIDELLAQ